MTVKTNRTCDFCGRDCNLDHGVIEGDRGRSHYGHNFFIDCCDHCYPKVFNAIRELTTDEIKEKKLRIV